MSLRLILIRHAKSSWDDPTMEDHDRPLNGRGRRSAVALGKWLTEKGYLPDIALCSTATRTRETLDRMALGTLPTRFDDTLYHSSTGVILNTLQNQTVGKCALIVTHNPGCADFADRIVAAPPAHDRFFDYPTGATLVVDLPAENWGDVAFHSGTVVDFVVPRELTD